MHLTDKEAFREQFKAIRLNMDKELKLSFDLLIQKRFFETPKYCESKIIFTYVSKPLEIDTTRIIQASLAAGKTVAVPRSLNNAKILEFYEIVSLKDLRLNKKLNIWEPILENCRLVTDFLDGLCVVPGLGFDVRGFRLGYGMGYYDRFLDKFGGTSIGLCYSDCVALELPHEHFDIPVQCLITELYTTKFEA